MLDKPRIVQTDAPYEGLGAAWGEFGAWIAAQGHTPAPDLWESYVTGPESSPDPATWRTELTQPPAFAPPVRRHQGEQVPGLLISQPEQCQFFLTVELRDDPRRPTAKPSPAGIEENGAGVAPLLLAGLFDACSDRPHMAGRIHDPADAVTPELVLRGKEDLSSAGDRPLQCSIHVLDVHEDHDR